MTAGFPNDEFRFQVYFLKRPAHCCISPLHGIEEEPGGRKAHPVHRDSDCCQFRFHKSGHFNIVEAHEGRVWAESPGHDEQRCPGSKFHVMLPIYTEPPDQPTKRLLGLEGENHHQETR